jgi:AraC-like DNA-binding protein
VAVTGRDGKKKESDILEGMEKKNFYVIDRHPEISSIVLEAPYCPEGIIPDGRLGEWDMTRAGLFLNAGDSVRVAACWSRDHLALAVSVNDKKLFCPGEKTYSVNQRGDRFPRLWRHDAVEINLDLNDDKSHFKDKNDLEILVSPDSHSYVRTSDLKNDGQALFWKGAWQYAVQYQGTLNDNSDTDTAYTIEVLFPWKALSLRAEEGLKIGFDVFQTNAEDSLLQRLFSSFSGASSLTNDNPSEWATLVLVKERGFPAAALAGILAVVLLCALLAIYLKGNRRTGDRTPSGEEAKSFYKGGRDLMGLMISHIEAHYKDPDFDLKKLSANFHFSYNYTSSLFKKETGKNFPDYLQDLRVEKAKQLLRNTDEKIAAIAFNVGFSSEDYFSRIFRKKTGQTPTAFRNP